MTKKIFLTLLILTIIFTKSYTQIKLPKGFNCVFGENNINESYFTDETFSFNDYAWGHEGLYGQDVVDAIEERYNQQLKFKRTKDNLYWATGKVDGIYIYIILVDNALEYKLSSKMNGVQFSKYSTWLLQQIRNNKKSGLDNYYTDYKGKNCSGIR